VVWRCNAGKQAVWSCTGKPRYISYGLRDLAGKVAGTPDLIGIVDGRFLALEVKLPDKKPTREQRRRLQEIRDHDGIAEVVHSVDEAIAMVEVIKRCGYAAWRAKELDR
jgi:hypothetical protein